MSRQLPFRLAPLAGALVTLSVSGCGGTAIETTSAAATAACSVPSLAPPIVTTSCDGLAGLDLAMCIAGNPPVCAVAPRTDKAGKTCLCTGTGTNLHTAVGAVALCGNQVDQTRAGLESKLCGVAVGVASGKADGACKKAQDFETAVFGQQSTAVPDAKINGEDATLLRRAAQEIEDAIASTGIVCDHVTP